MLPPVEHLAAELESLAVLSRGRARSLVGMINMATAMLNDGKETPAVKSLEAFQDAAWGYVPGGII